MAGSNCGLLWHPRGKQRGVPAPHSAKASNSSERTKVVGCSLVAGMCGRGRAGCWSRSGHGSQSSFWVSSGDRKTWAEIVTTAATATAMPSSCVCRRHPSVLSFFCMRPWRPMPTPQTLSGSACPHHEGPCLPHRPCMHRLNLWPCTCLLTHQGRLNFTGSESGNSWSVV